MMQSEVGNIWYYILETLGFPRWFAEPITIILAISCLVIMWYWCIKGIFIHKVEKKDQQKHPLEKERKLRQ